MDFKHDFDGEKHRLRLDELESLWFLAYTRARLEFMAVQNLQQHSFHAYIPFYKRLKILVQACKPFLSPCCPAIHSSEYRSEPSLLHLFVQPVALRRWLVLVMKLQCLNPTLWKPSAAGARAYFGMCN
ncbi:hypothetical protein RCH06_002858 [Polaromonas sp. CG_9.5]|uniref:hypothetical protein n=1 Tax=Polaromonas sp. CG_9.5 TaxID=3071705 RepID=UPI002E08AB5E|nr:hypothetical protein [Polaromonas sp. CG_9.5]